MKNRYSKLINSLLKKHKYNCPVCGSTRYITYCRDQELIIHCSSARAKFWNFAVKTRAHMVAKQHWDQSKLELFVTLDDVLEWVRLNEPFPDRSNSANEKEKML
jgi:hypothetical protein